MAPEGSEEEGPSLTMAELAEAKFLPIPVTASPAEMELLNGGMARLPAGVGQAGIADVLQGVSALRPRRQQLWQV